MNIKKPSIARMQNVGHLGRFTKDEFIQAGHNTYTDKDRRNDRLRRKGNDYIDALDEEKKYINRMANPIQSMYTFGLEDSIERDVKKSLRQDSEEARKEYERAKKE